MTELNENERENYLHSNLEVCVMFSNMYIRVRDILKADTAESGEDARSLIGEFKNGSTITLDFAGINSIGDEFAHELFVAWKKENKIATIKVFNAGDAVASTIERVLKTR